MIKNSKAEGSVTVFLSCILLIIIVFTCTVIDGTRIQIAKMQALRALRSATQSVIANYDSNIAHEYGVFSIEDDEKTPIEDRIEMYALAALQPKKNLPKINKIHQALYPDPPKEPFQLYDYNLEVSHVQQTGTLVEENADYLQLQILEYMKYRAPLLLIEPFMEKIQLMTKATKTTKFVKKKMEVEEQVTKIDDLYRELEKYIDGLIINEKGEITYKDYFVKKMAYKKEQDRTFLSGFPEGVVKDTLDKKIFRLYEDEALAIKNIREFDDNRSIMVSVYKNLYEIRKRLGELQSELSSLQSELSSKNAELSRLIATEKASLSRASDSLGNGSSGDVETSEAMKQLENEISDLHISISHVFDIIEDLEDDETSTSTRFHNVADKVYTARRRMIHYLQYVNSLERYRTDNHNALVVIDRIEKESSKIKGSIDALEKDLQKNKEELIESVSASIKSELQELKGRLAIPDDGKKTYHLTNNVIAMKDELVKNVKQLEELSPVGQELFQYIDQNNLYYMLYQLFDPNTDADIMQAFMKEVNQQTGSTYFTYPSHYIQNLKSYTDGQFVTHVRHKIDYINAGLSKYSYAFMAFDYGDMKTLTKEEKEKQDPRDQVTKVAENVVLAEDTHDVTGETNLNLLPSIAHPEQSQASLVTDEKVDFISRKNNNFMDKALGTFSNMADWIGKATMNLRDELYINEYIIGQFATATDHIEGSNPITLSGYPKDTHYLNHEVEYVLRGSLNENKNLKYVTHTILGMRFVMNYMHILTNTEKRTFIMGIATSIAGWWTFGLGVYIVAALIMAAWSYVESLVDVKYLLEGKKVPFFKTRTDWYTSFNGIVKGIVEEAADYATEKSVQMIDYLSDGVKGQVSYISERFNDEVGAYANDKISEVLDQAERTINYSLDEVDRVVDQVINDSFNHMRENLGNKPTAKDYVNIQDSQLVNHLINTIYRDYSHRIVEASYAGLLSIKKEILDKVKKQIMDTKEKSFSQYLSRLKAYPINLKTT